MNHKVRQVYRRVMQLIDEGFGGTSARTFADSPQGVSITKAIKGTKTGKTQSQISAAQSSVASILSQMARSSDPEELVALRNIAESIPKK